VRVNPWNVVIAAIAASWGFVSVIVAGVDLRGEALVFWRCALAGVALAGIMVVIGRRDALFLRRRRLEVLGLGILLACHWVLFFETIKRASVAVAILLVYTAPIFLAVLAPLFLPERRSRVGLLALAISAPGIALIALGGEEGAHASGIAVATGLGAALTYAVLIIWTKSVLRDVSALTIAFWDYVIVTGVLTPFLLIGGRALPTGSEWPVVIVLGVVLTAGLGALYVSTLRHVTAQAAGLLSYLEPVSAALLAWEILEEPLGWEVAVGGLAVLLGGAIVVLYEAAEPAAPEAPLATAEE
jgi:drug/metabolite transporter (DMT)-like permease